MNSFVEQNTNLKRDNKPLFTPTTIMETDNDKKFAFIIQNAYFNSCDQVVFTVSTNEISSSSTKLTRLPIGKLHNVRFDIDEENYDDWQTRNFTFTFDFSKKTVNFTIDDYINHSGGVNDFMKSIYQIQLTNMKGDTTVAFSVKYNSFQTFDLIMDDATMTIIKEVLIDGWPLGAGEWWNWDSWNIISDSNVKIAKTIRVFLFYKDSNGNDQKYTHSRLDWTKEQLIDYLKNITFKQAAGDYDRVIEMYKDFGENAKCNKIMGISCGDGGSSDTSNWQTLSPYYKWKDACSSAGKILLPNNENVEMSLLCCASKNYNEKCTSGCSAGGMGDRCW